MQLKYLRFKFFSKILVLGSPWARRARMKQFAQLASIREGMSVLDLGGAPSIWMAPFMPTLDITILNLPGIISRIDDSKQHRFTYIESDACDLPQLKDKTFDLVFSNSVIEHVGGPERRAAFAREVRRLGNSYWVQTPSMWFPIEAHCGMPFWWFYPRTLQRWLIEGWRRKLPAWTEMIEGTAVLQKSELKRLFPNANIITERLLGIPKSYSAFMIREERSTDLETGSIARSESP